MTSRFSRSLLMLIAVSLMLTGCVWKKKNRSRADDGTIAGIIGDLPELTVPEGDPVKPTRAEVLAAYEQVYGLIPDTIDNSMGMRPTSE